MNEAFVKFIKYLQKLKFTEIVEDTWATLVLRGNVEQLNLDELKLFGETLEELNASNLFTFDIERGEQNLSITELHPYTSGNFAKNSWTAKFSKHTFLGYQPSGIPKVNFFLSSENCKEWFKDIDVFDKRCPAYFDEGLVVYVGDLTKLIGNDLFSFRPLDIRMIASVADCKLPDIEKLKESIHFVTEPNFNVDPRRFTLDNYPNNELAAIFIKYGCQVLGCAMTDEIYSKEKIIFNGSRRVVFDCLSVDNDQINYQDYLDIKDAVCWIYEDKVSVRKKLFNDRFTLDVDESHTLIFNLRKYVCVALEQASERYVFVITERKDAYVKELKDLLKDLRVQSDLYSAKIRSLLSNFLRDALASLVLVGFTIFTKFSENISLDKHQLLIYVFWSLGIYFLFSIIMQSVNDCSDIMITSKEMRYWKSVSKELIPDVTFEKHFKTSLKDRRASLYVLYPFIALLYLSVAFCCFKYPFYFEKLISANQTQETKDKTTTTIKSAIQTHAKKWK